MASALNFRSSYRHPCNVVSNKNVDVVLSPGSSTFREMSDKQIRAHFKYCQIKTHVQTAREPHDLNMASDSVTNFYARIPILA